MNKPAHLTEPFVYPGMAKKSLANYFTRHPSPAVSELVYVRNSEEVLTWIQKNGLEEKVRKTDMEEIKYSTLSTYFAFVLSVPESYGRNIPSPIFIFPFTLKCFTEIGMDVLLRGHEYVHAQDFFAGILLQDGSLFPYDNPLYSLVLEMRALTSELSMQRAISGKCRRNELSQRGELDLVCKTLRAYKESLARSRRGVVLDSMVIQFLEYTVDCADQELACSLDAIENDLQLSVIAQ